MASFTGQAFNDSNNSRIVLTTTTLSSGSALLNVNPASGFGLMFYDNTSSNYGSTQCIFSDASNNITCSFGLGASNLSLIINGTTVATSNIISYVSNSNMMLAVRKDVNFVNMALNNTDIIKYTLSNDIIFDEGNITLTGNSGTLGTNNYIYNLSYVPITVITDPLQVNNTAYIQTLICSNIQNPSVIYSSNAIATLMGGSNIVTSNYTSLSTSNFTASNAVIQNATIGNLTTNLALSNLTLSNLITSNIAAQTIQLTTPQNTAWSFDYQTPVGNQVVPPYKSNQSYQFATSSNTYYTPFTGSNLYTLATTGATVTAQFTPTGAPFLNEKLWYIGNSNNLDSFYLARQGVGSNMMVVAYNSNVVAISNVIPVSIYQGSNYVVTTEYSESNLTVYVNGSNVLTTASNNLQDYYRQFTYVGRGFTGSYLNAQVQGVNYYPYVMPSNEILRDHTLLMQSNNYWSLPNKSMNDSFWVSPSNVINRQTFSNADHASFGSNVVVNSNLVVGQNIVCSNTFSNLGTVSVGSNLVVSGNCLFSNIVNVNGLCSLNGPTYTTGLLSNFQNVDMSSNLTVHGLATLSNAVVGQNLIALSNTQLSNLNVSGISTFASNVSINGILTVNNIEYIQSNVTIYNSETIQSNLTVYNATTLCNALSVGGSATVNSNLVVSGNIVASNTLSNIGNAFFLSNVQIAGPLNQIGVASFTQTVGISVAGSLSNLGTTSLAGQVTVLGSQSNQGSLSVSGALINPQFATLSNSYVSLSNSYIGFSNQTVASTAAGSAQGTYASNLAVNNSNTLYPIAIYASNGQFTGAISSAGATTSAPITINNSGRLTGLIMNGAQPGIYMTNTQSAQAWDLWVATTNEAQGAGAFTFYNQTASSLAAALQTNGTFQAYSNVQASGNMITTADNTSVSTSGRGIGFVKQFGAYDKLMYNNTNPFTVASVPQSDISTGISAMAPTTRMTIDSSGNTTFTGTLTVGTDGYSAQAPIGTASFGNVASNVIIGVEPAYNVGFGVIECFNSNNSQKQTLALQYYGGGVALGAPGGSSTTLVYGPTNIATAAGSVGIGTTSPGQKLQVSGGNALFQGPSAFNTSGNTSTVYIGDNNHSITAQNGLGTTIASYQNNNGIVLQDTTGYVGLGTSTPAYQLDVLNSARVQGILYAGTNVICAIETNAGNQTVIESFNSNNSAKLPLSLQYFGGNINVGGTSGSSTTLVYGPTNLATVSGSVGIGTTSPAYKLDVSGSTRLNGSAEIDGTLNMNNNAIYIHGTGDANHGLRYNSSVDGPQLTGFSGGALMTGTAFSTNQLTWNASGVSVNNTLTVAGSTQVGTLPTAPVGSLGIAQSGNFNTTNYLLYQNAGQTNVNAGSNINFSLSNSPVVQISSTQASFNVSVGVTAGMTVNSLQVGSHPTAIYGITRGIVTGISIGSSPATYTTMVFFPATLSTNPSMVLSVYTTTGTAVYCTANAYSVSTTGFGLSLQNVNGTPASNVAVHWMAIQ